MTTADLLQDLSRPDEQVIGDGLADDLIQKHYGIAGEKLRLPSERDQNIRVRTGDDDEYLVKIANPNETREITDFQTQALLHVEAVDAGVPVPRVIRTLSGGTEIEFVGPDTRRRTMRVLSYLKGKPLHTVRRTARQAHSLGACLGRLDNALKGFFHPGAGQPLLWDIRQAAKLRGLLVHSRREYRMVADPVLERFEYELSQKVRCLRGQVIHNDANAHNVLVHGDNESEISGIIDFGDMIHSQLVINVAVAATYQLDIAEDPLEGSAALIAAYHKAMPLERDEFDLLPDLIRTRLAVVIAITGWRSTIHPENIAYIQRYTDLAARMLDHLSTRPQREILEYFRDYKVSGQ